MKDRRAEGNGIFIIPQSLHVEIRKCICSGDKLRFCDNKKIEKALRNIGTESCMSCPGKSKCADGRKFIRSSQNFHIASAGHFTLRAQVRNMFSRAVGYLRSIELEYVA